MLAKAGLYFPYIHFRDDAWIKASALYWPGMARIVPANYPTRDSPTVRALAEDTNFVRDLRPTGAAQDETAKLFLSLLRSHGDVLAERLRVPPYPNHLGNQDGYGRLGFIYTRKMTVELRDALLGLGLAVQGEEDFRGRMHRPSADRDPANWIGVDERLAGVYMCVLAGKLATGNGLAPVTDQESAHLAAGSWTVERMAELLTGVVLGESAHADGLPLEETRAHKVVQLALDIQLPTGLESVPVERIIRFRERHAPEMAAFQDAVAKAAADLDDVPADADAQILDGYLQDSLQKHLLTPRKQLNEALKLLSGTTAISSLNVQSSVPMVAALGSGGVAGKPIIGAVAGAAVGVASVTLQRKERIRLARASAPAAAYLLDLERELAPRRGVRGALDRLRLRA